MRLSRKGWNNILIFGSLFVIFLFNFNFNEKFSSNTDELGVTPIPIELTILEINTPDHKIKRVGREWKAQPDMGLSSYQLSLLVQNWQTIPLQALKTNQLSTKFPYQIKIYVASEQEPFIFKLHQDKENYQLEGLDKTFLFLPEKQLPLFLGK